MSCKDAEFVDLNTHRNERLGTGNTRGMASEEAKPVGREQRLLHRRTQCLKRGDHRLLASVQPVYRREQRRRAVVDESRLNPQSFHMRNCDVEGAGKTGEVAQTSPGPLNTEGPGV